jgi:hypothetical protein
LETDAAYASATFADLVRWHASDPSLRTDSELFSLDPRRTWVYFDYKHLPEVFADGEPGSESEEFKVSIRSVSPDV